MNRRIQPVQEKGQKETTLKERMSTRVKKRRRVRGTCPRKIYEGPIDSAGDKKIPMRDRVVCHLCHRGAMIQSKADVEPR